MKVEMNVKFREIGRSIAVILFLVMVGMIIGWQTAPTPKPVQSTAWGTGV